MDAVSINPILYLCLLPAGLQMSNVTKQQEGEECSQNATTLHRLTPACPACEAGALAQVKENEHSGSLSTTVKERDRIF